MQNIEQGWLKNCRHIFSPHFDARPDIKDISLLVIHYISFQPEEFGGGYIEDIFQGKLDPTIHPYFKEIYRIRVSAHCLIERDGRITQYVSFNQRAWHAGLSGFQGGEKCNDFAIGIELEGSNEQPFTDAQYQAFMSSPLRSSTKILQEKGIFDAVMSDTVKTEVEVLNKERSALL